MDGNAENAIKRARIARGITQERLAEMAGCSSDSIRAWELGSRHPSVHTLETLSICLDSPWLVGVYLREQTDGALDDIVPAFTPGEPVSQAVIRLVDRVYAFSESHGDRRLMAIAEDNVITQAERQEFDAIMEDIRGIVEAALELRYCSQGE
jgi:transcriptional regulator with XRE-family HTH domain